MIVWVVYDISNNKTRSKLAKICKVQGLYRVQRSTFVGSLSVKEKKELKQMFEELIVDENDSVFILPAEKNSLSQADLIGKGFDKELVSDKIVSIII